MVVTGRMKLNYVAIILVLIVLIAISYLMNNTYERFQIYDLNSTFPGTAEEVSKAPETSIDSLSTTFPGTVEEVSKSSDNSNRNRGNNNEISEINNKLSEYLPKYDYAFNKMNTKLEYLNQALIPPRLIEGGQNNYPPVLSNPLPQETPITSEEIPLREQTIFNDMPPPENLKIE